MAVCNSILDLGGHTRPKHSIIHSLLAFSTSKCDLQILRSISHWNYSLLKTFEMMSLQTDTVVHSNSSSKVSILLVLLALSLANLWQSLKLVFCSSGFLLSVSVKNLQGL